MAMLLLGAIYLNGLVAVMGFVCTQKGKTMSDYIKRDDAIEVYSELYWMHEGLLNFEEELGKVYDEILGIPPADVAPVRHGRWEKNDYLFIDTLYRCSVCGEEFYLEVGTPKENGYRYCPNCGARMDGERKDNE